MLKSHKIYKLEVTVPQIVFVIILKPAMNSEPQLTTKSSTKGR